MLNRGTSIENTLILFKNLNKLFNDDYEGMNALDKYINNMNNDTSNKLIKLIDIYDRFDKFHSQFSSTPSIKNCTSDCIELFKGYSDECKKGNDYDFCYELKNFREQYNEFIKNVITCEDEQYFLPPVQMFDTGNMIIIPFVIIALAAFIFPILYKVIIRMIFSIFIIYYNK